MDKQQKILLMNNALKKFGQKQVTNALYDLYQWTRGDVFRINSKRMEILKSFITKPYPKKLYKGIRSDVFEIGDLKYRMERSSSGKDKTVAKNYLIKKLNKKLFNKYSSWSENPSIAAKFSSGDCILILKSIKTEDLICNVSAVTNDYKFSGLVKNNPLFFGNGGVYVPTNEKEWILYLKPESINRLIFWDVYFKTGKYLGDFSVDTLGLTKRNPSWHISPV